MNKGSSRLALLCIILLLTIGICTVSCSFDIFGGDTTNHDGSGAATACPPTIQYGSHGSWVKTLQLRLNTLGWKDQEEKALVVDSIFGSRTEGAVKNFQAKHNLQIDGIVGPKTWAALGYC